MREIIYIITAIAMYFCGLNVNNEVILQSSIQQIENVELGTFFISKNGTKFVFREKDKKSLNIVLDYLDDLPVQVKQGVKEIHFEDKNGNIAGVTKGNVITLYDYAAYNSSTQRDILYHEIGHTYANELNRVNNFNFDQYIENVKNDGNYISDYSKSKIKENNNYSEDFADAFSMYFREKNILRRKHKNRHEYIESLVYESY